MQYFGIIWAGVYLEDLEAGIRFYRDVLELPLVRKGPDFAHLNAGNGAMLELFTGGRRSSMPKDAARQSAVFALQVKNLEGSVEALKNRGVRFCGHIQQLEGSRWATLCDPEGNLIQIKEI